VGSSCRSGGHRRDGRLNQTAVWVAAALLVLLMFSSYALRSWSPRVASLALMGAITVYITGAGYITIGRIGWFVLALVVDFGWLALWETLILPDNPLRSLNLSVQAFSHRAADTVADVVDSLNTARDSTPSDHARKALHKSLDRARKCRSAIETQFPGAVVRGFSQNDVDQLRVALHSAQKGLEDMADQAEVPDWMRSLPDEIVWSISSTLHARAAALRDDVDEESSRRAQSSGTPRPHKPSAHANNEDWRDAVSARGAARGAHVARRWRDPRPIRHAGKEVGRRRIQGRRRRATKE
jgi:hypothetical protein